MVRFSDGWIEVFVCIWMLVTGLVPSIRCCHSFTAKNPNVSTFVPSAVWFSLGIKQDLDEQHKTQCKQL